ncbi:hypothetical protein WP12_20280 [Sphingomonas sp. SRS2]|nr:hypothetical protein WP12_20280 [Sphingomonas sp. SRS2]
MPFDMLGRVAALWVVRATRAMCAGGSGVGKLDVPRMLGCGFRQFADNSKGPAMLSIYPTGRDIVYTVNGIIA